MRLLALYLCHCTSGISWDDCPYNSYNARFHLKDSSTHFKSLPPLHTWVLPNPFNCLFTQRILGRLNLFLCWTTPKRPRTSLNVHYYSHIAHITSQVGIMENLIIRAFLVQPPFLFRVIFITILNASFRKFNNSVSNISCLLQTIIAKVYYFILLSF